MTSESASAISLREQSSSSENRLVDIADDNNSDLGAKNHDDDQEQPESYRENLIAFEQLDFFTVDPKTSYLYKENRPFWLNAACAALLIPFGMLEGYSFFACGMADPAAFRGQFTLSAWIILKLFIAAVGLSMVVFALFELIIPSFWYRKSDTRNFRVGYLRAAIGGAFTGIGMALSGTGATMLSAMIGAGVTNAWAMAVGFLAGGIIFSIVEKFFLKDYLAASAVCYPGKDKLTFDEKVGIRLYKIALPLGLVFFGFACVLEFAVPGTSRTDDQAKLSMGTLTWSAVAGGAVIALNQAPLLLLGNHQQGGSTAIVSFVSLITGGYLAPQAFPKWGVHVSQFLFVWVGSTAGALIGRFTAPPSTHSPTLEIPIWRCVVGGFLAVFAARFSDSCACGGLTSIGALGFEGVVLAVFMFGSAIATGFIIKEAGG